MHVFWFDLVYLTRLYISTLTLSPLETFITILPPSTESTTPELFATTHTPESLATCLSKPVPTKGFCGISVGTACLIMFDPMSALLASLFSKNGISDAATDRTCFGDTSINVIIPTLVKLVSP